MTIQDASERYHIPMHILREYERWGLCGAVEKVMGDWQYDDLSLIHISSIPEICTLCPIFRAHICPVALKKRGVQKFYTFFRVVKIPTSAASSTMGASLTNSHSNA